ncbi:MAG: hypothetical protein ACFCU6_15400 [Balneolaceae bacterium]
MNFEIIKFPLIIFLTFLVANCNVTDDTVLAQAEIIVTFRDSENDLPIANTNMEIGAIFEGGVEFIPQGTGQTDDDGILTGVVSSIDEVVITTLGFRFEIDGQQHNFTANVNLELRKQAPFQSVSLNFEI